MRRVRTSFLALGVFALAAFTTMAGTPPPAWQTYVLASSVDYGGNFSCPLNYPNAKHICEAQNVDVPFVVWETGPASLNNVVFTFWDGSAWLTPPEYISSNGASGDAGRIGICSDGNGAVHAAWHGNPTSSSGLYGVWYARCDPPDYFWTTPVAISDLSDTYGDYFPTITVDGSGNPWVVWLRGSLTLHYDAVLANHSADGGRTWSTANIDTISRARPGAEIIGGWTLPTCDCDPATGDVHVAWPDTNGNRGFAGINYSRYDASFGTWSAPERVAVANTYNHPLAMPAIAVDSHGDPRIVFQMNIMEGTGADGTLSGLNECGPTGWLAYTHKSGGRWSRPVAVHARVYPERQQMAGLPSLGIDELDNLYLVYTLPDSVDPDGNIYLPLDAYISILRRGSTRWSAPYNVSAISPSSQWNAIFPQINGDIASPVHPTMAAGPGIAWSQLQYALPPAQVLYKRLTRGMLEAVFADRSATDLDGAGRRKESLRLEAVRMAPAR